MHLYICIRCFACDGLIVLSFSPPALPCDVLPPQIYNLLKKNLSRYLLAETVDEPAVVPPASVETPEATSDGASPTSADAPSAESGDKVDAPSCSGTDAVAADAAKPSSASAQEKSSGENGGEKGGDEAKKVEAVVKTDPNGPKCVQLKMKPDWRKGSNKRRRGDLAGGEGRWAWPADRPEFCRFVLYKENSDTVGLGGVRGVRFVGIL